MKFATSFTPNQVCPTKNDEKSLTQQNFKDDCDINVLYKRFVKENGLDPLGMQNIEIDFSRPVSDLSDVHDLNDIFEIAAIADECFMRLPAEVRQNFGNDAVHFKDAISKFTPQELQKFGLFNSKQKGGLNHETPTQPSQVAQDVQKDGASNT